MFVQLPHRPDGARPLHFRHVMTLSDAEAAALRLLLGDVTREMATLFGPAPPEGITPAVALRAAWARLVGVLAPGPAPELRTCPVCQRDCRRAASLCGGCWTKLAPPLRDDAELPASRSGA
jgi:hypothetical protein